ncbi:MCE family protein [Mycolicibacter kumamotonensis]|uniref:MCE family protein n=1 Tax=Mycolicibacter kumamotonensis TaxID=354243 RepID=A0A7K3LHL3_9MYCO|nr:MCE family protein [Mycolicibacter kumamotonensis]
MESTRRGGGLHPAWWTLILFAAIGLFLSVTLSLFAGTFRKFVPVTLVSDRAGLVMESGGKVKMRGVEVGRVGTIQSGTGQVSLKLEIFPGQIRYIPANVDARIRATTAFGAKYVDLIYPEHPSPKRLSAGEVIRSQNVSNEVNTVFQTLTEVLDKIEPAKVNAVLAALAEGLRGEGPAIGDAITDGNQVLLALNSRAETFRRDWRSLKGFSDTYSAAADDIVSVLNAVSTTSTTITDNAKALDSLLLNLTGLSNAGIDLLGPNKDNLVHAINVLEPTTRLLMKYNPQLTCMLVGGKWFLDNGGYDFGGGNGKSAILDVAVLLGDDAYRYPDNLPVNGAKGGPGGKPSCGSLPIVDNNWPQRYLVTDSGWGTGMDVRPNPGIGFPGYVDYFPTTRGIPEPPSMRYPGGPAPGPEPTYPGAPPYGAPLYAADGSPLYPGLPPAPPPGAPREPGPPPPGSQPFVVPAPMQQQPTPTPPLPEQAAPSP